MGKRLGTVFVFKKGITEEQARKILESIKANIDMDFTYEQFLVQSFDDKYGSPVWYIP